MHDEVEDELSLGKKARVRPKTGQNGAKAPLIFWVLLGLILVGGGGFFALKALGIIKDDNIGGANQFTSYRTIGKIDLRAEASNTATIRASLKEGTILSGKSVGNKDGIEWIEATSVDGVHGFLPATSVQYVGKSTDLSQVIGGTRNVVISTNANLRALPSLSSQIIGAADGGTRLVSDGSVMSEGEQWLRVPLNAEITAFIMARFTTPDDDRVGNAEGFEAASGVGVGGVVAKVMNVQATPFDGARIIRPLAIGEQVRILGQTNAGIPWYIVRLIDGVQGFIPKDAITVMQTSNRWVYPDGTVAAGPNIPQPPKAKGNGLNGAQNGQNKDEPIKIDMSVGGDANGEIVTNTQEPAQPETPIEPQPQ